MKIWKSITLDMTNEIEPGRFAVISEDFTFYHGPIVELKGDGTAKDQLKTNNDYAAKYSAQQDAIRQQIMGGIGKYLNGGIGFDPAMKAAMTSQFLNNNTANFNAAGSSVRSALASRGAGGGDVPVGGDFVRGLEGLEGAKASSQSQGLLGVNIADANQAINNQFNAANVASGQTAQLGNSVANFNNSANSNLNSYISAANQGFGNAFTSALGGSLGKGLGQIATGGFGGGLQSISNSIGLPASVANGIGAATGNSGKG